MRKGSAKQACDTPAYRRISLALTFTLASVLLCGIVAPASAGERINLSLRVLALEARQRPEQPDVATLAGISRLEGYVIVPEDGDVILMGERLVGRPTLHLDDLAVNIRNAWSAEPQPYCSLDPRPQDVLALNRLLSSGEVMTSVADMENYFARLKEGWGPQMVVVGGVPPDSRHAHVMIDADYHMKKLSQGLAHVDGVPSCIDLYIRDAENDIRRGDRSPGSGMSMSRFWFHLAKGAPSFQANNAQTIVCLENCAVVVLTEAQRAAADGSLFDSGGDDPQAKAFASELSAHLEKAARQVTEYAELDNLFRLNVLVQAMNNQSAPEKAGLDLDFFMREYECRMKKPMPPSLPGLANSRTARVSFTPGNSTREYILFPMVCGGVSMESDASAEFGRAHAPQLEHLRQAVLASRPNRDTLCWPLPDSAAWWRQG